MIRNFKESDEQQVVSIWKCCDLIVPWNNSKADIQRKLAENPELFFVGQKENRIIATCMAGYDGHRGWVYYLAVHPDYQ